MWGILEGIVSRLFMHTSTPRLLHLSNPTVMARLTATRENVEEGFMSFNRKVVHIDHYSKSKMLFECRLMRITPLVTRHSTISSASGHLFRGFS